MASKQRTTTKKLSKKLVDKHQDMLKSSEKEFKLAQEITILKEKRDQLGHWAKSATDEKSAEKFLKDKEKTEKRLSNLNEEFKKISKGDDNPRKRYTLLEKEIEDHKEALAYWWDVYKGSGSKQ